MYLDVNTLAGPICKTTDELAKCIKNIDSVQEQYQSVYQEMNEIYIKRVGDSTQKIVDIIFKGKQEKSDCVFNVKEPHKKTF